MKQMKRILGLFLALVLVAAMCACPVSAAGNEKTVTIRVELMDATLIPPTEVTMPETHRTFADFGLSEADPGFDTPVHALAQYLVDEGYSDAADVYEILELSYSNLSSVLYTYANGDAVPDSSHFYMYMLNDRYPTPEGSSYGYNLAECPIADGDDIVIYAMAYPATAYYAYFETQSYTVEAGEPVSLRLLGQSTMGGAAAPLSGAKLILSGDGASPTIPTEIATGSDGTAQTVFQTAGTYTVSASRADCSRPSAVITVTASDPAADAGYVAADKTALSLPAQTKTNLTLPTVGASGKTTVSWSSDKPDVLSADGTVTRGAAEETVTLTATIQKAASTETRSFSVKVLPVSAGPAKMETITASAGTLAFSADTTEYLLKLPLGVSAVTLTPAAEGGSAVTVTGADPDGRGGYAAAPGDTVTFAAEDGTVYTVSVASVTALSAEWPQYRGAEGGVTHAKTARNASEASLLWAAALKDAADWETGMSDPIVIGGKVYVAVGDQVKAIGADGTTTASGTLSAPVGYTSRPLYADGLLFVPLEGGQVEALSADTLTPVWVSDAYDTDGTAHQSLSSLLYADGKLYGGTAAADWVSAYDGVFYCIDAKTGETLWTYRPADTGYYWGGAAFCSGVLVVGDDAGNLVSLDPDTGRQLSSWNAGAGIRSTIAADSGRVFFTTTDGRLHRVTVGADGAFSGQTAVSFAASSTSSPTVHGGIVYVGGAQGGDQNWAGVFCAVDAETMQIQKSAVLPADVKSAPLVSDGNGGVYAYFTSNTIPGGLYVFDAAKGTAEALYAPTGAMENYCMASVIADDAGTLYYTNDSGTLFAVRSSVKEDGEQSSSEPESSAPSSSEPEPSVPSGSSQTPSESGASSGGSADSGAQAPQTGDSAAPAVFLFLLCAAVLACLLLLRVKTLKKES